MKTYIKKIKHNFNTWSGYSLTDAFNIELECYNRLQYYSNFPKLISSDELEKTIELEYCGTPLDVLVSNHDILELIPNLISQLNDIWDSLNIAKIKHLDIQLKNFMFKDNTLYLIDFDIAVLDGELKSDEIRSLFNTNVSHLGRAFPDTGNRDSIVYINDRNYFVFYFLNLINKENNFKNHVQAEPYQIIDKLGGWRDCNQRWKYMEKYITHNTKSVSLDVGSAEGYFSKQIQNKTKGSVYSIEGSSYPYRRQLKYCSNEIKDRSINLINFYLNSSNVDFLTDRHYNYTLLLSVLHWIDNPNYILQRLSKVSDYMFIEIPSLNDTTTINSKYMSYIKNNYQNIDNYLESMTDKKILEKIEVPAHTSKTRSLYIIV
jgi:hypothetical protein